MEEIVLVKVLINKAAAPKIVQVHFLDFNMLISVAQKVKNLSN